MTCCSEREDDTQQTAEVRKWPRAALTPSQNCSRLWGSWAQLVYAHEAGRFCLDVGVEM